MSTLKLLIALTLAEADLPAGLEPGPYQVTMTRPDGSTDVQTNADPAAIVFQAPTPGDAMAAGAYGFEAVMLAATGERISEPASGSFTIAPDVVVRKINVPVGIAVSAA